LHGEIDRRERPETAARTQKRRAGPVDDIDRAAAYSAAAFGWRGLGLGCVGFG
jgi:hypothetical protein